MLSYRLRLQGMGPVVGAGPVDAIDVEWRGAAQPGSAAGTVTSDLGSARAGCAHRRQGVESPLRGLAEAPPARIREAGAGAAREPRSEDVSTRQLHPSADVCAPQLTYARRPNPFTDCGNGGVDLYPSAMAFIMGATLEESARAFPLASAPAPEGWGMERSSASRPSGSPSPLDSSVGPPIPRGVPSKG